MNEDGNMNTTADTANKASELRPDIDLNDPKLGLKIAAERTVASSRWTYLAQNLLRNRQRFAKNTLRNKFYTVHPTEADAKIRCFPMQRHIEPGEIHYVVNNSGAPMKMISTLAPYTNPDKVDVENYTY